MFVSLLALLSLPAPPVLVTVQAGQVADIRVNYPASLGLLSREAPSRITLQTPWGTVTARPTGSASSDPQFTGYFGKVNPILLWVPVPPTVSPGSYESYLNAELFVCDRARQTCSHKTLVRRLKLQVTAGGTGTAKVVELRLD